MREKDYDFPPFRPPSEADSLLLRATRGCPWNRCAFCPMYKGVAFEKRPVRDIEKDIDTAGAFTGGKVETVFIGDSDSLVMGAGDVCRVLEHLYLRFPNIGRVTTYARAQTLRRKSAQALTAIRQAGLTRLHIGLETGSGDLLKEIQKGAGPETMVSGVSKAREAGFEISVYVLLGIGGTEQSLRHAAETAELINRMAPDFIRVRTLAPQPGTDLYDRWQTGRFQLPDPEGILREQKHFIERLDVSCRYLSDHVTNYAPVNGRLPEDREAMISLLETTLKKLSEDEALKADLGGMPHRRRL